MADKGWLETTTLAAIAAERQRCVEDVCWLCAKRGESAYGPATNQGRAPMPFGDGDWWHEAGEDEPAYCFASAIHERAAREVEG